VAVRFERLCEVRRLVASSWGVIGDLGRAPSGDGDARTRARDGRQPPDDGGAGARQLGLDLRRVELPAKPKKRSTASAAPLGPRLALSPDEAAAVLGVSRDYLDERFMPELRIVRRGRRILIALAELERWLDHAAVRAAVAT
jgi:excisionase family DNA binding protein